MNRYRTGRRAAVHTRRSLRKALALAPFLDSLGTPPATSTDYVSAVWTQCPTGWPMYMNGPDPDMPPGVPASGVGDCTIADSCHQIMEHTANAGAIVIPTNAQALAAYEAVGGYVPGNEATDQGCDETAVCDYLMSTGIAEQKSAGTGMVDPTNIAHIKWCVQIFGAARIGAIVDDLMEQQFDSGQAWTTAAASNDPDAGGHDPPILYYDANYAYVCTWGNGHGFKGLQPVAWSLMANSMFLDEVHAEVWPDFVRAGGTAPSGFDLQGLLAKLQLVEQAA